MRNRIRFILFLFSFLVALFTLLLGWQILNPAVGATLLLWVQRLSGNIGTKTAVAIVCALFFLLSIFMMAYALLSERMRKTRVRENETGDVDIGIDAIESIALNSLNWPSRRKNGKGQSYSAKNNAIRIDLSVVLYSDVEIPAQMAIVQDRIKRRRALYRYPC